ncbi:MAG: hypothetical protein ACI8RA_001676 [Chlamydiales bacterium]|jgi:hypothetical protein
MPTIQRVPSSGGENEGGYPLIRIVIIYYSAWTTPNLKKQKENMETPENVETLFQICFKNFALLAIPGSIFLGLGGVILAIAYRGVKWIIAE